MVKKVEHIIVGLDFSEMDKHLIHFLTNHIHKLGEIKKVYFIHVEKNLECPEDIKELLGQYPYDETPKEGMIKELVCEGGGKLSSISSCFSVEGSPLEQILHWADIKKADAIVLGRKLKDDGTGVTAKKIARKSHSSILFIPTGKWGLKKILVPVDFSSHSKRAMQRAMEIANKIRGASVICYHAYNVPTGYSKTGKTYEQMTKIMLKNANDRMTAFLEKYKDTAISMQQICTLSDKKGPAMSIYNIAKEAGVDMIIMGSKGQTFSSWVLLGSEVEKLIEFNNDIPLYIVKDKNENIGFWQAIQKL